MERSNYKLLKQDKIQLAVFTPFNILANHIFPLSLALGNMMKASLLVILLLVSGCSSLSNTTNYEIEEGDNLFRVYVYDWCEENQYSLGAFGVDCLGVYNPPLYSSSYKDGIYVFYPMRINHSPVLFGPLIIPLIPLDGKPNVESINYKVRSIHKGSQPHIKPKKVTLYVNGIESSSCILKEEINDGISDIFTCNFDIDLKIIEKFYSLLTLDDETEIKLGYSKNKFWSYRPIVAPAGRAGNRGKYIHINK